MSEILETKIDAVTVYQSGARITRIGKITLDKGKHIIKIEKLTNTLDKESVRVKGSGTGRIINVNIEQEVTEVNKQPEIDDLKKQIKLIDKEIAQINEDINDMNTIHAKYDTFSQTFYEKAALFYSANELDLDKISKMEDHIISKDSDYRKNLRDKQEQLENKNLESLILKRKLTHLGPAREFEEYFEILINIEASESGDFELELQFQLPGASWVPFYDVNLSEEDATVKLLGNVFNNSGDDWDNVLLEISSANLQPVKIIEPTPFLVDEKAYPVYARREKKKPMRPIMLKSPKMDLKMEESYDMDDELEGFAEAEPTIEPSPPMKQSHAKISESVSAQSYSFNERISIPSDDNPHPITLMETELESEKGYFWSVSAPDLVITKDKLTNRDLLLLPGNAKVYYCGEFIGESELPLIAPQETVELGTRRSYDLKVEKKIKNRKANKEGLLKGKITKHYEYEILVTVLKDTGHPIKIMDRMVHSNSEKIKVIHTEFNIQPESKNLGVLTWNLNIKDKKEMKINYKFDVSYEKGIEISPNLP